MMEESDLFIAEQIEVAEYVFEFYDNEDFTVKSATLLARTTTAANRAIEQIAPYHRRTKLIGGEEQDTLELRKRATITANSYLVDISVAGSIGANDRRAESRPWKTSQKRLAIVTPIKPKQKA